MGGRSKVYASHLIIQWGLGIFAMLFLYSTLIYPGGSTANFDSVGFSWKYNYVCNLMNHLAMNGEPNPSRPYAIFSIVILSATIAYFFFNFSKLMRFHGFWSPAIKRTGIAAMLLSTMIFTRYHDVVTILSSLFAAVAVVGVLRTLIVERWTGFVISGVLILILLAVNNYIYYTGVGIEYLPALQKWTFGIVLLWVLILHSFLVEEWGSKPNKV